MFGLANIIISSIWIGKSPATYYIYYTAKVMVLFGIRIPFYIKQVDDGIAAHPKADGHFTPLNSLSRLQKTHYYFFDFCYIANILLLLHCWVPPLWSNVWLWKVSLAAFAHPFLHSNLKHSAPTTPVATAAHKLTLLSSRFLPSGDFRLLCRASCLVHPCA